MVLFLGRDLKEFLLVEFLTLSLRLSLSISLGLLLVEIFEELVFAIFKEHLSESRHGELTAFLTLDSEF